MHVGTDSMQTGPHTQFVTVVAVLNPPHGGRGAYTREVVPRISSLRERLLKEVWRSVEFALGITDIVKGELTVHIDANPIVTHKSSRYVKELTALVVSQGFRSVVKPDAWAASHAADHIVRTQGKLPKREDV